MSRWTGEEVFHRSVVEVPTLIAAYNIFMNSVDRMDQISSTAPTRRAEKRLKMTIFTWILDLALHSTNEVYVQLRRMDKSFRDTNFQEFKRRVEEQLELPLRTTQDANQCPQQER